MDLYKDIHGLYSKQCKTMKSPMSELPVMENNAMKPSGELALVIFTMQSSYNLLQCKGQLPFT